MSNGSAAWAYMYGAFATALLATILMTAPYYMAAKARSKQDVRLTRRVNAVALLVDLVLAFGGVSFSLAPASAIALFLLVFAVPALINALSLKPQSAQIPISAHRDQPDAMSPSE